jgi:hypothetical protein
MGKKVIFFFFTVLFFMIYTVMFHKLFSAVGMIEILIPYGILLFLFEIFFSIVILFPASVVTTKKVFEVIEGS